MRWPGVAVLWVFVFLSDVILINLLIALMSDTFSNVKKRGGPNELASVAR